MASDQPSPGAMLSQRAGRAIDLIDVMDFEARNTFVVAVQQAIEGGSEVPEWVSALLAESDQIHADGFTAAPDALGAWPHPRFEPMGLPPLPAGGSAEAAAMRARLGVVEYEDDSDVLDGSLAED